MGITIRGFVGQLFARVSRVLTDGTLSIFFRRDMAEMGTLELPQRAPRG